VCVREEKVRVRQSVCVREREERGVLLGGARWAQEQPRQSARGGPGLGKPCQDTVLVF